MNADLNLVACPSCFKNFGFRRAVEYVAEESSGSCPNCKTNSGLRVTLGQLKEAMRTFFVYGSFVSETYASVYNVSEYNNRPAIFDDTLDEDAVLSSKLSGQVIFHYGPPLWRLGYTNHYYDFEVGGETRSAAARELVLDSPSLIIAPNTLLFRIRLNLEADEQITLPKSFDPPPEGLEREAGRWDDVTFPVLYVSDEIELCLHECRAAISDEILLATLISKRPLQILDLSGTLRRNGLTPFDDPNIFVGIMSRNRGATWREFSRATARAALEAGYDGIRYNSYYSQAKGDQCSLNLAIFGRPLGAGILGIKSLNRIRFSDMAYKFSLGPTLYRDAEMRKEIEDLLGGDRDTNDNSHSTS